MNEIQMFDNAEFGEIRTIEENGKILFCGKDVAKALGYAKPNNAISTHCRCTLKRGIPHPQSPDKQIEMIFISEGDVYRLITHSKLPNAERFEEWVFDEVLPTIRKTGSYTMPVEEEVSDDDKDPRIKIIEKLMEVAQMDGLSKTYECILFDIAREILTGKTILQIESAKKPKTYLAGDIARIFGTTAYQIGCIANVLSMKNKEYGEWYYYTRPTDDEKIRAFKYNEKAVEKFRLIFESMDK
ncbi:MAG: hypothetical protein NC205_00845 [Prevotella sp.]|nr:hypothetical protein [Alistipes senegalensis]MCM1357110.1 hypothetical protein [Prevotella sp.]MCM1472568.1 hypothetical protein [Muribaculaceae bacterium]